MNKFNLQALNVFRSPINVSFLREKLIGRFSSVRDSDKINEYIMASMPYFIDNFAETAGRQLLYSNLAYGGAAGGEDMRAPQVEAIVAALNRRFYEDRVQFIQQISQSGWPNYLSKANDEMIEMGDGLTSTSRTIISRAPREYLNDKDTDKINYEKSNYVSGRNDPFDGRTEDSRRPDDLLQSWRKGAASSIKMSYRDDTVGQINMRENLAGYGNECLGPQDTFNFCNNSKEKFTGVQRLDRSVPFSAGREIIDSPIKDNRVKCGPINSDPGYFAKNNRYQKEGPVERKLVKNNFNKFDMSESRAAGRGQYSLGPGRDVINISGDASSAASAAPFLLVDHDRLLKDDAPLYDAKCDFYCDNNSSQGCSPLSVRSWKSAATGNLFDQQTKGKVWQDPTMIVQAANVQNRPGDNLSEVIYANSGEKNISVENDAQGEYSGQHVDRFLQNKGIQMLNSNSDYSSDYGTKYNKDVIDPFTDNIKVNHARRYPSLFYDNKCGEGKDCNYKTISNIVKYPPADLIDLNDNNDNNKIDNNKIDNNKIDNNKKENFGWKPRGTPGYYVDKSGRYVSIDKVIAAPTSAENNLFLHDGIGVKPLLTLEERKAGKMGGYAINSAPMPGSEERCFWNKEVGGPLCPDPQNNVKLWKDSWSVHADESNPREFQRYMGRRINRTYGKVRPPNVCPPGSKNVNCGVYKDEFDIKAQIIDSIYRAEASGPNGLINEDAMGAVGDRAIEQIPWWRRGIQNRAYDYDGEESLGGFEFGSQSRGYDMDSLNCRVSRTLPAGSCNSNYKQLSILGLPKSAAIKKISELRPF